jgi:hypothetical protein
LAVSLVNLVSKGVWINNSETGMPVLPDGDADPF